MRRVIVLGGLGLFGRAAVQLLGKLGIRAETASRGPGADLQIDANDPESVRAELRAGDVVVDTAGPFQARSTALVEEAIDTGFDVVDVKDSLSYAERIIGMESQIRAAAIRVASAASTVSAVSAAVVQRSGIATPVRVSGFLAPATRFTANVGTARSLVESVGQPIRVWRDGRMQTVTGWSDPRHWTLPEPVGPICGRLFESADSLYLPRIWPSLREVTMRVDTRTPGVNSMLRLAANFPGLRRLIIAQLPLATWFARRFGASAGGVGYEIEDPHGKIVRYALVAQRVGHLTAVMPAVIAARAIVEDRFPARGLVSPDRIVEPAELFSFLESNGILSSPAQLMNSLR